MRQGMNSVWHTGRPSFMLARHGPMLQMGSWLRGHRPRSHCKEDPSSALHSSREGTWLLRKALSVSEVSQAPHLTPVPPGPQFSYPCNRLIPLSGIFWEFCEEAQSPCTPGAFSTACFCPQTKRLCLPWEEGYKRVRGYRIQET